MSKLIFSVVLIVFTLGYTFGKPVTKKVYSPEGTGCVCEKFSCGCCLYMDVPEICLNDTACVNFAYMPNDYGISFTVTIDDTTLINETISARNPPPICFPVPVLEDFVDVCVHFTDLDISNTKFHGCVQLELRMWWVYVVTEYNLGCFDAKIPSGEFEKLLKQATKHEVLYFQNLEVNETFKYNLIPMQDIYLNHTISTVPLKQDTQVHVTSNTTVATNQDMQVDPMIKDKLFSNQDLQVNQTLANLAMLHWCKNKSNLINLSPYLVILVVWQLSGLLKF